MMFYQSVSEAWLDQLDAVAGLGTGPDPRGMLTSERTFTSFRVLRPLTFPVIAEGRDFRQAIGALEGLSLVGQVSVTELFTDRIRKFHDFTDDGVFHGAYGARVHGQIGDLVRVLQQDPHSRQAVLSIFDATRDLDRPKKDIPCTVAIQFLFREGRLDMGVYMRSNDLWLGTPYDLTQFAILQASVAQALGMRLGEYTHSTGSLHLYERDRPKLTALKPVYDPRSEWPWPLWNANNLAEIVERARRILLGVLPLDATDFEAWAWQTLHG